MTPRTTLSDDELDRLLGAHDPVSRSAFQADGVTDSLARLHDSLLAGAPQARSSNPRRWSRRPARRRLAVSVSAIGIAAAVMLVGVTGVERESSGGGASFAVSPAAAATLNGLARAAGAHAGVARPLGPNQDEYSKTIVSELGLTGARHWRVRYLETSVVQRWVAVNGASRILTRYEPISWLTGADRATYRTYRSSVQAALRGGAEPGRVIITDFKDPASDGTRESAAGPGLPSTPHALLRALRTQYQAQLRQIPVSKRRRFATPYNEDLLGALENILAGSSSPAQRAAAYTDVKYVPGVRVIGDKRDATGRPGVAITLAGPGLVGANSSELIVDPTTGALLQSEALTRRAHDGTPAGVVVYRQVYLQHGIVGSMEMLPDGGRIPYRVRLGR